MPFVQVADVSDDMKLVNDTKQKISKVAQPMSVCAEEGSVLVTLQGSIGRVAITQYKAFVDRTVLIFDKYNADIDKTFWAYIIKEKFIEEARKAPGGTIKTITKEVLSDFDMMLSSYDEQKMLGKLLHSLDHLITLHQRKQSCICLMCITKSWEQRKIGDYYEFKNGLNKGKEFFGEGTPIVNFADVFHNRGISPEMLSGKVRLELSEIKNYEVKKGDIFFTRTSETIEEIGYPSVMLGEPENTVFSGFVLRGRCFLKDDPLDNLFKKYIFFTDAFRNEMLRKSSMTTRALTSGTAIKNMEFLHPSSKKEQHKIGELLTNLDHLITLHQRKKNMYLKGYFRRKIMIGFDKEADFEQALITALQSNGWEKQVIQHPTEKQLIQNWADILFENNRDIDRLNDCPLVQEEMDELIEQIKRLRTPLALNSFINGKTVSITRKNPKDTLHYGKEVSLKIYDRMEIAAGQSRYQIVQQPLFPRHQKVLQDRRGDLMLLINGMPLFHIELKRSGIPVSEACNQIGKYAHEGVFTGLFSLIQVFVAMNPEETLYFANPGPDGKLNSDFFFHWADFNNEPINDWRKVASTILSIPMAHQLIGFYTVADDSDGILKVMRSYQYYAANKISDRVSKNDWTAGKQLGGYIWHTTGSGKTMTSFKSAQLIANSRDADKVVFLMDRIELGTQSLKEYRAFADNADDIQETEDTVALIGKLKSIDPKDTLIVSSIQKMSNIREDAASKMQAKDLLDMQSKRFSSSAYIHHSMKYCIRNSHSDLYYLYSRTNYSV